MKIFKLAGIFVAFVTILVLIINRCSNSAKDMGQQDNIEVTVYQDTRNDLTTPIINCNPKPSNAINKEDGNIIAETPSQKNGNIENTTPMSSALALDELKKQLVQNYNDNSWRKCKSIIAQNKELGKYKDDLEYIFKIRQNRAFDPKGFKNPKLDETKIDLLKSANYINNDNKPTDAFNITSVDDIADKKNTLESLLSAF